MVELVYIEYVVVFLDIIDKRYEHDKILLAQISFSKHRLTVSKFFFVLDQVNLLGHGVD